MLVMVVLLCQGVGGARLGGKTAHGGATGAWPGREHLAEELGPVLGDRSSGLGGVGAPRGLP